MRLLNQLERKFGRWAIPNLTLGLIACQIVTFVLIQAMTEPEEAALVALGVAPPGLEQKLELIPQLVLEGEVWRLVTFLIVPPITNVVFAFFCWYMFFLMGSSLEQQWGNFRYNVYLLIGYLATVAVSFLIPNLPSSNGYIGASVFLAFAHLFPNFEIYLFFILPVRIKWLALIAWIGCFWEVATGDWLTRILVLASICNFLLFFGRDIWYQMKTGQRRMSTQTARIKAKPREFFHRCAVCGITDQSHPQMEFRYCSGCTGSQGYCTEHLHHHEHVTEA